MGMLIFYLALALGVSFLCSLVEATILSLSRSQTALLAKEGRLSGKLLESMKQNVDRPLAAILTLNTVSHTIGAAGVGAQSFVVFGERWVAVSSVILTILILVVSEIVPKTIGAVYATRFAGFTAFTVQGMIILTYPLVVVFQALSKLLSGGHKKQGLTREEFGLMAELGQLDGALQQREYHVIRNLLRLRSIRVDSIMTPRTVALMLDQTLTVQQTIDQFEPLHFSRMPVYDEHIDNVVGVAHRVTIYEKIGDNEPTCTLKQIAKPLHSIPENATVRDALDSFLARREHLFLVVDEHGGTAGLVTLEDTIETLLDVEIVDETDTVADMRQLSRSLYERKMKSNPFGGRR